MRPSMRFLRHRGIYRSDVISKPKPKRAQPGAGCRLPLVGPQAPVQGRDGRNHAPHSSASSAMSSGRLFLDRVARQHCPSPLHRQLHPKTVPGWGTMDLQRTANSVLTVCLSQGDNRTTAIRPGVPRDPARPATGKPAMSTLRTARARSAPLLRLESLLKRSLDSQSRLVV